MVTIPTANPPGAVMMHCLIQYSANNYVLYPSLTNCVQNHKSKSLILYDYVTVFDA